LPDNREYIKIQEWLFECYQVDPAPNQFSPKSFQTQVVLAPSRFASMMSYPCVSVFQTCQTVAASSKSVTPVETSYFPLYAYHSGHTFCLSEGMNESYSHSSFFIATVWQNKDFQISHTLKLAWVLSSCKL
jgi:hypothetical protein